MKKPIVLILAIYCYNFLPAQTHNESLGSGAGHWITTGDNNVFIGDSAGTFVTSGSKNTFLGYKAGSPIISGNPSFTQSENVAIGYRAFGGNPSSLYSTDNVIIGAYAGFNHSGTDVVFLGTEAGYHNNSGSDNVFIGEESGYNNTSGDDNVFVGEDAGFNNTTASDNTFVGNTAGRSNTTGYRNAFFGNDAGWDNTTGNWNTFIGDSAGVDNSTGICNTFVGQGSGAATEYADFNTFIGFKAGWDNNRTNNQSNANRNTYVGYRTGYKNREGQDNVGMGAGADFSGSTINCNRNVFFGAGSIVPDNTDDAVLLGFETYVNKDFAIGIGSGADIRATRSIGIGYAVDINKQGAIGIGSQTFVDGEYSIAIGELDSISAPFAVGIGYKVFVNDSNAIAIGNNAIANNKYAIAIGSDAVVNSPNSMVLGGNTTSTRVSVGIGTDSPNAFASLELADTDKGFLINRLTTTLRNALGGNLSIIDKGLMVFDTDLDQSMIWNGAQWLSDGDADATNEFNTSVVLTDTILEIVDGGGAITVDLSSLIDDADADASNEFNTSAVLSGTNLNIVDGGGTLSVDLSPLVLSDNDEQDLTGASLTGTILQIDIENGASATVDLAELVIGLQSQIEVLTERLDTLESIVDGCCGTTLVQEQDLIDNASLGQNYPNPTNQNTTIEYYLPYSSNNAYIEIINSNGALVKTININSRGNGHAIIEIQNMANGTYYYTLFANGQMVDTKQLLVTR